MKITIAAAFLGLMVLQQPGPAEAQRIMRGGLRGTIASASVEVPAESDATVYSVPAGPHFVLTQVCFDGGGMVLTGSSFGAIPTDLGLCTTYQPGIAIPVGDTLSCYNPNSVPIHCLVTGVLTH